MENLFERLSKSLYSDPEVIVQKAADAPTTSSPEKSRYGARTRKVSSSVQFQLVPDPFNADVFECSKLDAIVGANNAMEVDLLPLSPAQISQDSPQFATVISLSHAIHCTSAFTEESISKSPKKNPEPTPNSYAKREILKAKRLKKPKPEPQEFSRKETHDLEHLLSELHQQCKLRNSISVPDLLITSVEVIRSLEENLSLETGKTKARLLEQRKLYESLLKRAVAHTQMSYKNGM